MICIESPLGKAGALLLTAAAELFFCCTAAAQEAQPGASAAAEPPAALRHVAAAMELAGADLQAVAEGYLCRSPQAAQAYLLPYIAPLLDGSDELISASAFDNFHYLGLRFVGTWVLETDDGLILFDAMFNEAQARDVVVAGLRKLGLEPNRLKHVIVSHGHADHYGGARYLQVSYGARIWLSARDWDLIQEHQAEPIPVFQAMWPETPPLRDGVIEDGAVLELGDHTVRFVLTPGHTPGTVSAVIAVDDGGVRRYVTMWGGTAMPPDADGVGQMHASLLKLWQAGQDAGAEGVVSTHAFVEDSFGRFDRKANAPANPFNLGRDGFNRMMAIHSECILAQAARLQAGNR